VDFLDLPEAHSEQELQTAIIVNLKRFLLELGRDFAFVGEQYLLPVGGQDFRLDLSSMNSPNPERKPRQQGRLATADERPPAGAKVLQRAMLDLDAIPGEHPLYALATACGGGLTPRQLWRAPLAGAGIRQPLTTAAISTGRNGFASAAVRPLVGLAISLLFSLPRISRYIFQHGLRDGYTLAFGCRVGQVKLFDKRPVPFAQALRSRLPRRGKETHDRRYAIEVPIEVDLR
jgi:YhcG PDDEXK nuclease domain